MDASLPPMYPKLKNDYHIQLNLVIKVPSKMANNFIILNHRPAKFDMGMTINCFIEFFSMLLSKTRVGQMLLLVKHGPRPSRL